MKNALQVLSRRDFFRTHRLTPILVGRGMPFRGLPWEQLWHRTVLSIHWWDLLWGPKAPWPRCVIITCKNCDPWLVPPDPCRGGVEGHSSPWGCLGTNQQLGIPLAIFSLPPAALRVPCASPRDHQGSTVESPPITKCICRGYPVGCHMQRRFPLGDHHRK